MLISLKMEGVLSFPSLQSSALSKKTLCNVLTYTLCFKFPVKHLLQPSSEHRGSSLPFPPSLMVTIHLRRSSSGMEINVLH